MRFSKFIVQVLTCFLNKVGFIVLAAIFFLQSFLPIAQKYLQDSFTHDNLNRILRMTNSS